MPKIQLSNFTCEYTLENFGHEKTLVLSNSLGTNLSMWEPTIDVLSHHFNILRYDKRGHGASTIHQDQMSIAELGQDVIELLDHLNLNKVYFCGISIGGLTGQWLGIHHPERFEKIILCNTAAKIGTKEDWLARIKQVHEHGLSSIISGTQERWFSPEFASKHPDQVHAILEEFQKNSVQGYNACCAALSEADLRYELHKLNVPILIIAGSQDQVTTVKDGIYIQKRAPITHLVTLDAAHQSPIEHPVEFAKHIIHFTQH